MIETIEMNKIKFSHLYIKQMKGNCRWYGKLIQVVKINKKELSKEFVEYDTKYEGGNYPLPNGDLILLLFLSDNDLWTTIRRYIPRKFEYYKKLEGRDFEVIRDD